MGALIRLLRIQDWYYLLGIALLAVVQYPVRPAFMDVFRVFSFVSVYLCLGYVFNNLFDRDEDFAPKNPFKEMDQKHAILITSSLTLGLMVIAAWNELLSETLALIALSFAYSAPPWRLKRFLPAALVLNGVFFGFIHYASSKILATGSAGETAVSPSLEFTSYVFLIFLPLQYVHSLEHRETAGRSVRTGHKLAALGFFALPCLPTIWHGTEGLHPLRELTLLYSAACMAALLLIASPARARKAVRVISMAFGILLVAAHLVPC
ncbi:MAG: hypothetical protein NDJ89_02890 [Oligoflexia bacterium]|nr:hypothetical protein [Oligoflexia bacterium]